MYFEEVTFKITVIMKCTPTQKEVLMGLAKKEQAIISCNEIFLFYYVEKTCTNKLTAVLTAG